MAETVERGRVHDFAPAFVERRLAAALEAEEHGRMAVAAAEVARALAVAPHEPRAHALAAVYAALSDRRRAALRHARRAMAVTPVSAGVAYWVGVARHIVGAHVGALEALEIASALEPEDAAARALLARVRNAVSETRVASGAADEGAA